MDQCHLLRVCTHSTRAHLSCMSRLSHRTLWPLRGCSSNSSNSNCSSSSSSRRVVSDRPLGLPRLLVEVLEVTYRDRTRLLRIHRHFSLFSNSGTSLSPSLSPSPSPSLKLSLDNSNRAKGPSNPRTPPPPPHPNPAVPPPPKDPTTTRSSWTAHASPAS